MSKPVDDLRGSVTGVDFTMAGNTDLRLMMISAGFEHGGNAIQRLFDGHPELYVYPFESQLGNNIFSDYLSSLFHFKYRYPEFPASGNCEDNYELFYDQEMKVRIRTPLVSKFRDADIQLKEADRKQRFVELLKGKPQTRANIVATFFQATFDTWTNLSRSGREHIYVGYSPVIGIDADRLLADFPNGHVVHVIRNPVSAYAETKHRPFPQSLHRYAMTWNLLHQIALTYAYRYPNNFHILRYEDLISDPEKHLRCLCQKLGLSFSDTLRYLSWNGKRLDEVYPWGTIKKPTPEADRATRSELSKEERDEIRSLTTVMRKVLGYEDL